MLADRIWLMIGSIKHRLILPKPSLPTAASYCIITKADTGVKGKIKKAGDISGPGLFRTFVLIT